MATVEQLTSLLLGRGPREPFALCRASPHLISISLPNWGYISAKKQHACHLLTPRKKKKKCKFSQVRVPFNSQESTAKKHQPTKMQDETTPFFSPNKYGDDQNSRPTAQEQALVTQKLSQHFFSYQRSSIANGLWTSSFENHKSDKSSDFPGFSSL